MQATAVLDDDASLASLSVPIFDGEGFTKAKTHMPLRRLSTGTMCTNFMCTKIKRMGSKGQQGQGKPDFRLKLPGRGVKRAKKHTLLRRLSVGTNFMLTPVHQDCNASTAAQGVPWSWTEGQHGDPRPAPPWGPRLCGSGSCAATRGGRRTR